MPPVYDSLVGRDDVAALIPEDASRQIIQDLPKASVALSSFRMARMSRHQQRVPVLNFLPTAYWVGSDTGIKQTTEQQWANLYLDARELAVLMPIPEVVLDDADFDIWGEIARASPRPWARRSTRRLTVAACHPALRTLPNTWCRSGVIAPRRLDVTADSCRHGRMHTTVAIVHPTMPATSSSVWVRGYRSTRSSGRTIPGAHRSS